MMKMQMVMAQVHSPTNKDWNQSPNSGPNSISFNLLSSPPTTEEMSMLVCPTITPAALLTTLWEASKMPMTISQVWVTMTTAQADLNTHLKNIQVSTSFRLLRSVMS